MPAEELQKVKNNFAAYEYRRLTSNMSILMQLIFNDGLGDWREINEAGPKHQAVTAADVKRVANTYFTKENRTVAIYTRKARRQNERTACKMKRRLIVDCFDCLARGQRKRDARLPSRTARRSSSFRRWFMSRPTPKEFRVELKDRAGRVRRDATANCRWSISRSIFAPAITWKPDGNEGLAELTGYLLAHGGTVPRPPKNWKNGSPFWPQTSNSTFGDTQGSVSLNLLSKDLDEGLAPFARGADRAAISGGQDSPCASSSCSRPCASAMTIRPTSRRASAASSLYGENFWTNRHTTEASVKSVTPDEMREFHQKWFHPANFVVAASGDFDRAEMIRKLEELFADWPFNGESRPPIPTNTNSPNRAFTSWIRM